MTLASNFLLAFNLYGQEVGWGDLSVVALLVLLEGVLSIDNALVLGLLAKRLPPGQRQRALTYGLVGAFAFRFLAVCTASYLLKWHIVKLLGGGYLVYIAVKHLFFESREDHDEHVITDASGEPVLVGESGEPLGREQEAEEIEQRVPIPVSQELSGRAPLRSYAKFWPTVFVIEMTDIAFAVDSILAAIALVGGPPKDHPNDAFHPKLWVVITGGLLGVILMRFAAVIFIKLLERFPRFETSAYLLVIVIGGKLLADWGFNSEEYPHVVNFHDYTHFEFWVFWILMLVCFCIGFIPKKNKSKPVLHS